jgi:flagellar biosynthesis protein FlhF
MDVELTAAPNVKPLLLGPERARVPFATEAYVPPAGDRAADESRAAVVNSLRADLRSEIRAVRQALGRPSAATADASGVAEELASMREALEQLTPAPKNKRATSILRARGIEGRAAVELTRAAKGDGPTLERLRARASEMLAPAPWPLPEKGRRVVIAAVGQSGVGKTTTLAKLATLAKVSGKSVAFMTCDTFRVGGIEQAKRYATLLGISFDVARTLEELEARLEKTHAEIVMVDTSGRPASAGAAELLLRSSAWDKSLGRRFDRHVLLCAPGVSREVDIARAVRCYAGTSPTALALTKLDETSMPSGILHAAWVTRLPIALSCAGPRVPEDISKFDKAALIDALLPMPQATPARAA